MAFVIIIFFQWQINNRAVTHIATKPHAFIASFNTPAGPECSRFVERRLSQGLFLRGTNYCASGRIAKICFTIKGSRWS